MASLHDVAKLSGVSKSTVSRVINNEYGVKASTKEKVQKAIEACGYVANQVGQRSEITENQSDWCDSAAFCFQCDCERT